MAKEVDLDLKEVIQQHKYDDPGQFLLDPLLDAINQANISLPHY